jgi:hypothetical protein
MTGKDLLAAPWDWKRRRQHRERPWTDPIVEADAAGVGFRSKSSSLK